MKNPDIYVNLLRGLSEKSTVAFREAGGNQILRRQLQKRHIIHALVVLKMLSRALKKDAEQGNCTKEGYKSLRILTGKAVADVLYSAVDLKIRLKDHEYRAIFNISAEAWRENYKHKKPGDTIDIAFVQKLSDEEFIDCMHDYMIDEILKHPEARQQVRNYVNYELGIPV